MIVSVIDHTGRNAMIDIQQPITTACRNPEVRRGGAFARAGRDAGYVLAMFGSSIAEFWILAACVLATAILLPTVIGALVGVASAFVLRGLAEVDRRLAGWYTGRPIRGRYRKPSQRGAIALVKTVGSDPRTWKDAGWALGNSFAGFAMATVAIVVTGLALSYITTPLWWWAVPHPHENYAVLNLGIYTVTSTSLALITSAIGLALAPLAIALNRAIAGAHARMARGALQG
jgi:Putative sensor